MRNRLVIGLILSLFAASSTGYASQYVIDETHSGVTFKIRHLLTKVSGRFDKFTGSFTYVPNKPEQWKVEAKIETASINTNVEKRDNHLRTNQFFDVNNPSKPEYKHITFTSKKVSDVKGNKAKLHGDLTIKGIKKPVVLDLEIGGEAKDPWGNQKSAFTATTTVNRKDFGLTWNEKLETGGLLVGDEVEITLEIEGNLKQ